MGLMRTSMGAYFKHVSHDSCTALHALRSRTVRRVKVLSTLRQACCSEGWKKG
jgi:hypothetical protein